MLTTKIKILISLFVVFLLSSLLAQKPDTVKCKIFHDNSVNRDYYKQTDTSPTYKGSNELMFAYFRNNIVLPNNCQPGCHRMYAELIVEKDGKLTLIKILSKNVPQELKDAFKKAIINMPNWTPATCNKKNVAAYFVIPFSVKVS